MGIREREDLSDDELISGYLNGETHDFNVLYERYKRQLYSYLNRLLPGQYALVDDIFQQTWMKIIHQLPKYKSRQRFLAWAMRIAHNLAIDHFRKGKYEDNSVSAEDRLKYVSEEKREPWRDMDMSELGQALSWALNQLNPELREVFLLRQDGLSFKEIAEIQDCSLNTALGRMQYALKNLQKLLTEWKEGGK
jgi:RNA polymerase sigma-70 factor (ECF subfamily)